MVHVVHVSDNHRTKDLSWNRTKRSGNSKPKNFKIPTATPFLNYEITFPEFSPSEGRQGERKNHSTGIENAMCIEDEEPANPENDQDVRKAVCQFIKPNDDPRFIFTCNPLFSLVITFGSFVQAEQAGISLCNEHIVVTLLGYLYHEARRSGAMTLKWPAMDEMIAM